MFFGSLHKIIILGFPATPTHDNKIGGNGIEQPRTGGNDRVSVAEASEDSSEAESGGGSEVGNAEDSEIRVSERWTKSAESERGLNGGSATHSLEENEGRAEGGVGEGESEIGSE